MSHGLVDDGKQLEECLKEELERDRLRKLAREAEIELIQKYAKKNLQSASDDSSKNTK